MSEKKNGKKKSIRLSHVCITQHLSYWELVYMSLDEVWNGN